MKNTLIISMALIAVLITQHAFCEVIKERVYINDDSLSVFDVTADRNGDIYIGQNPHGVLKYVDGGWVQLHTDPTLTLAFDNDNALWVRWEGMFGKYSDGEWTYFTYDSTQYNLSFISAVTDNIVWALNYQAGVCRFNFNDNTATVFTEDDGLAYKWGRFIRTTPDGHVWISHTSWGFCEGCVYEGVSHYDGEKWETFTVDDGLLDNEVSAIVAYSATEVYIGGNGGIARYNGNTLEPFDDSRTDTMAKGPDGVLWTATWEDYDTPQRRQVYKKYHNGEVTEHDRNDEYWPHEIVIDKFENIWSRFGFILYKTTTDVVSIESEPAMQQLTVSAAPNPFNPVTTVTYDIPEDAHIQLTIHSVTGQKVATLIESRQSAGRHSTTWNASKYASGVYFYRLEADGRTAHGKMLLMK